MPVIAAPSRPTPQNRTLPSAAPMLHPSSALRVPATRRRDRRSVAAVPGCAGRASGAGTSAARADRLDERRCRHSPWMGAGFLSREGTRTPTGGEHAADGDSSIARTHHSIHRATNHQPHDPRSRHLSPPAPTPPAFIPTEAHPPAGCASPQPLGNGTVAVTRTTLSGAVQRPSEQRARVEMTRAMCSRRRSAAPAVASRLRRGARGRGLADRRAEPFSPPAKNRLRTGVALKPLVSQGMPSTHAIAARR